jgi:hypothetical protein
MGYGVIYWLEGNTKIKVVETADGGLWVGSSIAEANAKAKETEDRLDVGCRVISLNGVSGGTDNSFISRRASEKKHYANKGR